MALGSWRCHGLATGLRGPGVFAGRLVLISTATRPLSCLVQASGVLTQTFGGTDVSFLTQRGAAAVRPRCGLGVALPVTVWLRSGKSMLSWSTHVPVAPQGWRGRVAKLAGCAARLLALY